MIRTLLTIEGTVLLCLWVTDTWAGPTISYDCENTTNCPAVTISDCYENHLCRVRNQTTQSHVRDVEPGDNFERIYVVNGSHHYKVYKCPPRS
jgi:hypothetical protein